MELSWLEDFLALASCGSFREAAARRHVTQPAFGRRIRALEDWVGAPLFDRSGRRVVPTAAGRAFGPAAEEMLRRLLLARDQAREAGEASAATLLLASTHLLSSTFFPRWLSDVERAAGRRFPFQFIVDNMVACERLMRRGEVRLLLCHHHDAAPADLDPNAFVRLPIGQDRLVPVSAPDERGAPRHVLGDGDAAVDVLLYRPESGLGRILARSGVIERLTDRLRPVFHAHAALTLLSVARTGRGVAWVPASAKAADFAGGSLVRAGDTEWEVEAGICLVRPRARQAPALEEFWAQVLRVA